MRTRTLSRAFATPSNTGLPPEPRRVSASGSLRFGLFALLAAGLLSPVVAEDVKPAGASAEAAAPGGPATFKPTKEQLASLKIVTIARTGFRAEHVTDGKIALNLDRTTPVFSPYSGRVTQVLAGPGDVVKQGQPLAALQASEFVQGQSDLLSAQAGQASATAQLSLAQTNEKRKHALFDAKAGSLQDWQQSQSDLAAAQSAARTADAALAAVRNRLAILGKSESDINALARAEKMDAVAYIVAPINGTITDRQVGPGQYLQSGASNPAFTVANLSTVWLVANVRETDAPFVKKGETVEVHVVALPDRVFTARVTFVAPTLDPNSRRLMVRAEIANPDGQLKPEMFASFNIVSGSQAQAPAVPDSGVIYEGSEARVWIAGDDGTLSLRKIRPGRSANGMLEVLEGVKAGEKVVASGALFIDRAAQGD
jgi:cobalt-zinc-cadmium efflux system membrane fusion protein